MLINSTIVDVCRKAEVLPDAMLGVINRRIESRTAWDTLPPFTVIGIDRNRAFLALEQDTFA
jgi:hypothetical protein